MIPGVGTVSTTSLSTTMDPKDPKSVAAKMQQMFMEIMIKSMEDSIGSEDGMYGNSSASEIYRGMCREQLGATLGSKIGSSLEDTLVEGMKKATTKAMGIENPEDGISGISILGGAAGAGALPIPISSNSSKLSAPMQGLPVSGIVTSEVGWRKDPFTGAMAFHKGTDIAAPQGRISPPS